MSNSRGSGHAERRATRRLDLNISVKVWRGDHTVDVDSRDISPGGMKLVFTSADVGRPFEIGEHLDLEFSLPLLSNPVISKGEIRWVTADTCGVQFTAVHPRVVSAINRLHAR